MLPHSGHDYDLLCTRWRTVADRTGLHLIELWEAGNHPVWVIENESAAAGEPGGLYVSAGVHGDECAPVWGLLDWAESDPEIFHACPVVIFPCLNPHGFIGNTRLDHNGIDLNRCFENADYPVIGAWQKFLEGRHFETALTLHEDYDASGIYLYELARISSRGDDLLAACESLISRETASQVDGSDFINGLLSRSDEMEKVVKEEHGGGYPEAIFLYLKYATNSFTFETPSELDLSLRVDTQRTFLEAVVRWMKS